MTLRFDDRAAIVAELKRYRHLEECLLVEARIPCPGVDLELTFDYIWDDEDPARRRVLDQPKRLMLALEGLGEVVFNAALPRSLVSDPDRADWGMTEVAVVSLADARDLAGGGRSSSDGRPHRLIVAWEGRRRLEASFRRLVVRADGRS